MGLLEIDIFRDLILVKKISWLLVALIFLVMIGFIRVHQLNQKPSDPSAFSWFNKAEVYTLGLLMVAIAYPLYPEISREHLMLYSPFNGETTVIHDDFFLRSLKVQKAVDEAARTGKEVRLWWSNRDYEFRLDFDKYWESRVALAFNGGWLRVEGKKVIARIPIKYPKRAFAPFFSVPFIGTFGIQEGLFWVLQEEGWYHTGEVEWVAEI